MEWRDRDPGLGQGSLRPFGAEVDQVGLQNGHRQAVGPGGERLDHLGVALDGDHAIALFGEVQGDPPRAGAELEHRAAGRSRELLPEGQVGGEGAELDVLPDPLLGRQRLLPGHCQYSLASPRSESSVRSSSSAV